MTQMDTDEKRRVRGLGGLITDNRRFGVGGVILIGDFDGYGYAGDGSGRD